jgi:hypothetical protein
LTGGSAVPGCARVAVGDPQPAAGPVLARLGDVYAEVVDDKPDPRDRQLVDTVAVLSVGAAVEVGSEQPVNELCGGADYVG